MKCYRTINELPADIRGIIFMTPKEETLTVARKVIVHGIKDLWIQQGAESKETVAALEKEDVNPDPQPVHHDVLETRRDPFLSPFSEENLRGSPCMTGNIQTSRS